MPHPTAPYRVCPTRTDGRAVLVAQKVTAALCQDRQRGRYHKCFSCAYNNGWVEQNGMPTRARRRAPAVPPIEELEPVAAAVESEPGGGHESAEPVEVEVGVDTAPGAVRAADDEAGDAEGSEAEAAPKVAVEAAKVAS